jgi:hypothetical protein
MTPKAHKLHEMNVRAGVLAAPRSSGRSTSYGSATTAADSNVSGVGSLLTRI